RIDGTELQNQSKIDHGVAQKAALAEAGQGARLVRTELAVENDSLVYEVLVSVGGKRREILVDAGTGKVVKEGETGSIVLGLEKKAKIAKPDAEKIALRTVSGKDADKSIGESMISVVRSYLVYG